MDLLLLSPPHSEGQSVHFSSRKLQNTRQKERRGLTQFSLPGGALGSGCGSRLGFQLALGWERSPPLPPDLLKGVRFLRPLAPTELFGMWSH